jgi:hypothetical protein
MRNLATASFLLLLFFAVFIDIAVLGVYIEGGSSRVVKYYGQSGKLLNILIAIITHVGVVLGIIGMRYNLNESNK